MLVPCWFTVFVFWPGHSTTKSQAWHGCFCFVFRWWNSGKITSEILCIAKCCHQECAAHDCSRFAHARRGSFWVLTSFLLGPYEDLLTVLTVCSQFAHGFLTVCSCCSRFAHALGDDVSILMKKPTSKPCHIFCSEPCVPKARSLQAADSLRLIFKSETKTPTCHSQPFAEAGLPHPCLSLRYVCATFLLSPKDSKSIPILWYHDMFLCSPKGPNSTSIHGIVQRSF